MAGNGGKLYRNHPKNMNHVHKDIKYLVSVIITLGKDISGEDTVFNDGVKSSDFGIRTRIYVCRSGLRGPLAYSLLGGGVPTQSIG